MRAKELPAGPQNGLGNSDGLKGVFTELFWVLDIHQKIRYFGVRINSLIIQKNSKVREEQTFGKRV